MRALAIALVLALVAPAWADDLQRAQEHFARGQQFHQAGEYDLAIAEFLAASELHPSPLFFFNIAQSYRGKGDAPHALEYYRKYLAADANGPAAEMARLRVAELTVDLPTPSPTPTPPTPLTPTLTPTPTPVRPAPAPRRSRTGLRIAGWITLGVGVSATAAGVYFGLRARDLGDQITDKVADGEWHREYDALYSDGEAAERNMAIAYAVGGAALITGGVLLYFGHRSLPAPVPLREGGVALVLGGSY